MSDDELSRRARVVAERIHAFRCGCTAGAEGRATVAIVPDGWRYIWPCDWGKVGVAVTKDPEGLAMVEGYWGLK